MVNISSVSKMLGGVDIFTDATCQIGPGEKIGLVGPNGAGKTTLLRMIVGEMRPDSGAISIRSNVRMAYFSQQVGEMRGRSALQEVVAGNQRLSELSGLLKTYEDKLCDPALEPDEMERILNRMGEDQTEYEKLGGFDIESTAQTILTGLGIAPVDHARPVEDFSSGWKMRIALAKVLILAPELILMDEPTNYLDMETILWLEDWLRNFKGAILMTTHDRDFINRVVSRIVEVAGGTLTSFSGNYDFFEHEKAIRLKQNEAEYNRQQSMLKKEERFIARFAARASHASQVQSRVKMLDKIEKVELVSEDDAMSIDLPVIPRGGNDVVAIRNLAKSWKSSDGREIPVFAGLNAVVRRQDRIAVVGVNGAGKSTFLNTICGNTRPTAGEAIVGPSISIGYFGQLSLETLDPEATAFDEVQGRLPGAKYSTVRNLLAAFLFRGDDILKKVKVLSGGEKTRLVLSFLLSTPHNCLVLDEPTNHLDMRSREVLLDALKRYEGTLLIVSHDRFFLREIANRVFEVDRGSINVYDGNYQRYLDNRK